MRQKLTITCKKNSRVFIKAIYHGDYFHSFALKNYMKNWNEF